MQYYIYHNALNWHFEVKRDFQPMANLRLLNTSLHNVMGAVST